MSLDSTSYRDIWSGFATGIKRHTGLTMINKILRQMADEFGLCEGTESAAPAG